MIAYLKLLDNYHESSALFRVLNMEPFDIGHSDIININRFARRKNWSLFEALASHLAITDISKEARTKIDALLLAINKHSQMSSKTGASRLFVHIVNDLGILKNKDHDKEKEFFSLLNQFYQKIVKYEKTEPGIKLKEFMAFLELEFEAGETGSLSLDYEDSETVKIMTVHAAKGIGIQICFYSADG
jgi:DNA helicase II / ATP-dependent DNA helicase PcrA